jgi:hypothetical protein
MSRGAPWAVSAAGVIALERLRASPLDLLDILALEAFADPDSEPPPKER